jgi:hypothetical protein
VKGHRTRVLLLVGAAAILLALVLSPAASAVQVTKIMWGNPSVDVWAFTPSARGSLNYKLTWTDPFTNQKPDWPVATGQVVTMVGDNGSPETFTQPYTQDLYDGTQQGTTVSPLQAKSFTVGASNLGNTFYFLIEAYDQDVKYDFTLDWVPSTGSPLLDVCGSGSHGKLLTGAAAEDYLPAAADPTGTFLDVMGPWPPCPTAPTGDNFTGQYDNYIYETDYTATGSTYVEQYQYQYASGTTGANQTTDAYQTAAPFSGAKYNGSYYYPSPAQQFQVVPSLWLVADYGTAAQPLNNPMGDVTGLTLLQPGDKPTANNVARLTSFGRTRTPVWDTWSFPTTANASPIVATPGYLWAPVDDASASKESYATETSTAGSVTNRFYATGSDPSVVWVHSTGPAGGKYNIYIDNVLTSSYQDNYSASMTYKVQTPINGLALGYHTIRVESAKAKNASSTGYNLYHDAFYGWDAPPYVWSAPYTFIWTDDGHHDSTYYDMQNNSDGFTTYKWGQATDTVTAGGPHTVAAAGSTNAAAAVTFNGTGINIQYLKGPHAGIFDVYVDGLRVGNGIDGYAAARAYATFTLATINPARPNNLHTVLVVVRGTKNASSDGTLVYLDYFQPTGTGAGAIVQAELP